MTRTFADALPTRHDASPASRVNPAADGFAVWLAKNWLAVSIGLLVLYAGLPWLAPVFMKLGWTTPADAIYLLHRCGRR